MVVDWLAFPVLVLVLSFGCGLLVERVGGWALPGALLPGVGLALIVVAASLITESKTTSRYAPWLVILLALVGYATSMRRIRTLRLDAYCVGVAVVVFLVFAAPVLAFGRPSFLGYGIDGDPAFHFLFARSLIAHGRQSVATLPFQGSATQILASSYLASAYPFGGDVALGALRPLVGQDVPWIYDPFIAVGLTFGALALQELLRDAVRSRPLRALSAFIAAQAGLAYSFYLISSIKELFTTFLVTLLVIVGVRTLQRGPSARALAPLIVVTAAELYVLAAPAIAWLGIPLLIFVIVSVIRIRRRLRRPSPRALAGLVVTAAVGGALVLPILSSAVTSFDTTTAVLGSQGGGASIGNLLAPLSVWQIMGIWPNGSYRMSITVHVALVDALLWLAVASAVLGAIWSITRRAWGPIVLLFSNGIAALVLLEQSTPYAASKVEMILSITAVLAAMLGAVALHDWVRPWLGWTLAVVLALAVLWTNSKSFRQAPLAPSGRFAELSEINARFHGDGPTYYDLWDFEWPAYFLRDIGPYLPHIYGDPETPGASAHRTAPQLQYPWDLADVSYHFQTKYKLMVIGRSPIATRPPSDYRLVLQGRYYNVYRRTAKPKVIRHVITSDVPDAPLYRPAALTCRRIERLGRTAAADGRRLAVATQDAVASVRATESLRPLTWAALPLDASAVANGLTMPLTGGSLDAEIHVPAAGRYTVWVEGSLTQKMSVDIAGRYVGAISQQIGPGGLFTDVGTARLPAGRQPVILHRSDETPFVPTNPKDVLGEIVLTRTGAPPLVHEIAAADAHSLCGQRLQWIEIVR